MGGQDFYGPYDARDFAVQHGKELGMDLMSFEMMVYAPDHEKYYPVNAVPDNLRVLKLSGTGVRRRLKTGEEIPSWFSFPEVVKILRVAHPPRSKDFASFSLVFPVLEKRPSQMLFKKNSWKCKTE